MRTEDISESHADCPCDCKTCSGACHFARRDCRRALARERRKKRDDARALHASHDYVRLSHGVDYVAELKVDRSDLRMIAAFAQSNISMRAVC